VDGLARHDAIPLEERARERRATLCVRWSVLAREGRQERPASLASRRPAPPRPKRPPAEGAPVLSRSSPHEGAQRCERVVSDFARPDEVPQRRNEIARERSRCPREVREEEGAAGAKDFADAQSELPLGGRCGPGQKIGAVGQVERDTAVGRAERLDPAPDDLAGGTEEIEVGGAIARDASRKDLALQSGGGQRAPLKLLDRREERIESLARRIDSLPLGEKPPERLGEHGLDLTPELRERATLQRAQDLGVAPFPGPAARQELPLDDPPLARKTLEGGPHGRDRQVEPGGDRVGEEWNMRPRIPRHEVSERIGWRFQKRSGKATRNYDSESVAQPPRVLRCGEAALAGDRDRDDPPVARERLDPQGGLLGDRRPQTDLRFREIAE